MIHSENRNMCRFLICLAAALVLLILPVRAFADQTDSEDTNSEQTVHIPGFTESNYGYTYTGNATIVVVPPVITELNHYMFYKNNTLKAVVVPAGVAYVSDYAFYKCNNLRYILFLTGTAKVTDHFIYKAPSLINISAPKNSNVYNLCVKDQIPVTAAKGPCYSRKTVYLLPGDSQHMPLFNSLDAVYSSGSRKIVKVDKNGNIHALKKGNAVITALSGGKKYSYKVVVYQKNQTQRVKQVRKSESLSSRKMNTVSKVKAVHDWMIRNVSYDYSSLLKGKIPGVAHTSQGSLIRRLCVCDGYAYGFLKIMNSLHIHCKVVRGRADGRSHAWNMVRIAGKWYHVDVTWDDPIIGDSNTNTVPQYDYFLKSTAYMKAHSHSFKEKNYPKCTSRKYDKKGINAGYRNTLDKVVYAW